MADTYVITEACIGVKDATCVEVCPAACIHTTPDAPQYYIDPDVCIACEQCVLVCPVNAIFLDDEVPAHLSQYIEINAAFFRGTKQAAPPLTPEQATSILDAARRYVSEAGIEAAIAVVGPAGDLLAEATTPGCPPDAAGLALNKAYTAANLQVATHQLGRSTSPTIDYPPGFDAGRLTEVGGGYPVVEGDSTIGAIGVAGTPSTQIDLQCCQAGLAALRSSQHPH
jgi:uncharacterized protein GlcG (DUF336 family)/NAD-dependent dihydropyrimidine dehydrogenase PreA subunit